MNTILSKDELVVKAFNNNIVLVNVNNTEKILFGRGIGFGKKPGSIIKKGTEIEKVFIIEDESNRKNLFEVIEQTNEEFFGICEEAIFEISKEIKSEFNESIHIGLIDHLFLALKRIKNNEEIENPFLIQIQTLYSKEYYLAERMANLLEREFDIIMPESEIGFIALHIHSGLSHEQVSDTLKDTQIIDKSMQLIKILSNKEVDEEELTYTRLLSHLYYMIVRTRTGQAVNIDLNDFMINNYKKATDIAEQVCSYISQQLEMKLDSMEVGYLAIHVQRYLAN